MNVLSLFDGISCGQIALSNAGIPVEKYFASEIKNTAHSLVMKRFPHTIHLGDVRSIEYIVDRFDLRNGDSWLQLQPCKIDLLLGGSPCKGNSSLNQNREGLKHPESALFWEYVRIYRQLKRANPSLKFLLENTPGNRETTNIITQTMGVRPIRLNSSLVSAQNRIRLYWTNIGVNTMPPIRRITTKDVFDDNMPEELLASDGRIKWLNNESGKASVKKGYTRINPYPKSGCITAKGHAKWNCNYILKDGKYRVLSIKELERLQTLPAGYCDGLEYAEAYDLIGDGWTIDIISHILKHINK